MNFSNPGRERVESIGCPLLSQIFATNLVERAGGRKLPMAGNIPAEFALALYDAVLAAKPERVVEIGMGYGIATLAMLAALNKLGGPRKLITIDPFQRDYFDSVGLENVRRAELSQVHQFRAEPDYLALPDLVRSGTRIQFAYVDGNHRFDYTLLDFFFLHKMLDVGGVVGFNDCGYRAVHRVLRFIQSHHHYGEINVGLRARYRGRNLLFTAARLLFRHPSADRYFKKQDNFDPSWNFYAPF